MKDYKIFKFGELKSADLIVDALYKGGTSGNFSDDPINILLGCGNQGGFRYTGSLETQIKFCVLFSTLVNINWPDYLDKETGIFTYYGDNKNPGHELHNTSKKGNAVLRYSFNSIHNGNRQYIPPFFIFTKGPQGRDVFFRGLAIPGGKSINQNEDLVAIWKTKDGQRFQNYKASFTILDTPVISREWISNLQKSNSLFKETPLEWKLWVENGIYKPLIAPKTNIHRTKQQQIPNTDKQTKLINTVIQYFKNHPKKEYAFEECAVDLVMLMDSNIISCDLTKPWRDGGRDAIGKYRIGASSNAIEVEFSLEAKCKNINNGSGIRDTSRLLSRLRYRQFGIFITTSYISEQAYKEIVEDEHPVVIISGSDILKILMDHGYTTIKLIEEFLHSKYSYK